RSTTYSSSPSPRGRSRATPSSSPPSATARRKSSPSRRGRASNMKRYSLSALLLVAFALPARAEEEKPVTVPFDLLKTKHMTVMVKINGKGPYRLIFDTGAPVTLLNSKLGKEAGLVKGGGGLLSGLSGTPAKAESLEVGDMKAKDVPVIVMDHPTVAA